MKVASFPNAVIGNPEQEMRILDSHLKHVGMTLCDGVYFLRQAFESPELLEDESEDFDLESGFVSDLDSGFDSFFEDLSEKEDDVLPPDFL